MTLRWLDQIADQRAWAAVRLWRGKLSARNPRALDQPADAGHFAGLGTLNQATERLADGIMPALAIGASLGNGTRLGSLVIHGRDETGREADWVIEFADALDTVLEESDDGAGLVALFAYREGDDTIARLPPAPQPNGKRAPGVTLVLDHDFYTPRFENLHPDADELRLIDLAEIRRLADEFGVPLTAWMPAQKKPKLRVVANNDTAAEGRAGRIIRRASAEPASADPPKIEVQEPQKGDEPAQKTSQTVAVTLFRDKYAATAEQRELTLAEFAALIRETSAPAKERLPLLKLAIFGDAATVNDSLRHNNNVIAITGVEADYDGETVGIGEALERLERADILAIVYTSPSHRPEAPRWRAICPFSAELQPDDHYRLLARLNGLLGGIVASESFTLSQAYYYGAIRGNPPPQVEIVSGRPIDLADELDDIALGKANGRNTDPGDRASAEPEAEIEDIAAALDVIPNEDLDWDSWNRIGMAAWAASAGSEEGFSAFDQWSAKSKKYDAAETDARWDHYGRSPPSELGFGTLAYLAQHADPEWVQPSRRPRRIEGEEDEPQSAPHLSEEQLALEFAEQHSDRTRHVAAWGKWLLWHDSRWVDDSTLKVFSLARVFCRGVAKRIIDSGGDEQKTLGAARRIASAHNVAAIVTLARADRRLAVPPEHFDADIWLLSTEVSNDD